MKKILLFCVAILAVTQIYAAEYAIVGSFTNPTWDFSASRSANGVLVEKDGKYVTEIENLTSGFKIVDIENNNWDIQYGVPSGNQHQQTVSHKWRQYQKHQSTILFMV